MYAISLWQEHNLNFIVLLLHRIIITHLSYGAQSIKYLTELFHNRYIFVDKINLIHANVSSIIPDCPLVYERGIKSTSTKLYPATHEDILRERSQEKR